MIQEDWEKLLDFETPFRTVSVKDNREYGLKVRRSQNTESVKKNQKLASIISPPKVLRKNDSAYRNSHIPLTCIVVPLDLKIPPNQQKGLIIRAFRKLILKIKPQ